MVRDDGARDAHLADQGRGMQRPGAAEGQASVKSRGSRPRSISTERSAPTMLLSAILRMATAVSSGDRPTRSATAPMAARGALRVELHRAAEEVLGIDPAEHHIGVGDRGPGAALGRSRPGPDRRRRSRADPQHAALVDPGDRPAARADGADVDDRDLDGHAPLDLEIGREGSRPVDTVETSVDVPPMSSVTRWSAGQLGHVAAGDHAAGGSRDGQSCTGVAAAASKVISPPFERMSTAGRRSPPRPDLARIAFSRRPTTGLR
jgi:hypothetical protein